MQVRMLLSLCAPELNINEISEGKGDEEKCWRLWRLWEALQKLQSYREKKYVRLNCLKGTKMRNSKSLTIAMFLIAMWCT